MHKFLSLDQLIQFYDRMGAKQDTQAFYEDPATDCLLTHVDFRNAHQVFELGCGTGRFAQKLLNNCLPQDCTYRGVDVSAVMVQLAQKRLGRWPQRARVDLVTKVGLSDFNECCDHFVANYVLDLMSPDQIRSTLNDAHRMLSPQGELCLVSLTKGQKLLSKSVTAAWRLIHHLNPSLVGGCRPIVIEEFVKASHWKITYNKTVSAYGVPSEILIATRVGSH